MNDQWTSSDKEDIHHLCSVALKAVLDGKLKDGGFTSERFSMSIMRQTNGDVTVRINQLGRMPIK